MVPYTYETTNSALLRDLRLQSHPEGGYFVETVRDNDTVQSPFVDITGNGEDRTRTLSTTIFYLLTPDAPDNYMHMNASTTMHVLHQGRSEYVLIYPPNHLVYKSAHPTIKRIVMGPNAGAGEVRQLFVESGVWKKSSLLKEDLEEVASGRADKESVGCLITEVVVPGFDWRDHKWMSKAELDRLIPDNEEYREIRKELIAHVKTD